MSLCECRCRKETEGGAFLPGHDQRLRTDLEAGVGGLLALRDLVDAVERYMTGDSAIEDLGKEIRRVYSLKRNAV